jgi:hypothetical protein
MPNVRRKHANKLTAISFTNDLTIALKYKKN